MTRVYCTKNIEGDLTISISRVIKWHYVCDRRFYVSTLLMFYWILNNQMFLSLALSYSPRFGIAHALCLGLAPWLAAEVPILVDSGMIKHKDDATTSTES